MREIVNRLKENRQTELAKSILESAGYKVSKESKALKESALDQFWDLYDSSPEIGDVLRKLAIELGIDPDEEPTEEEAIRILKAYKGEGNSTEVESADKIIDIVLESLEDASDLISSVTTFEEAGLMTKNKGFVIKTTSGKSYQFSLLGSF